MIVRTFDEARGTDRRVTAETWESVRLLLAADGMGFSLHVTTIHAGTTTPMCYRHHLEAVFCIAGEGEVETTADHAVYPIVPGTVYALDRHDDHILRATTTMRLLCVFTPPLKGKEVHDATGAYPLDADVAGATPPGSPSEGQER
jgi:L-ectoine synthase